MKNECFLIFASVLFCIPVRARAFRWLLDQTNYSADTDTTRVPEVINRAYGFDFSSPVPE
jgi:hypothetical protein